MQDAINSGCEGRSEQEMVDFVVKRLRPLGIISDNKAVGLPLLQALQTLSRQLIGGIVDLADLTYVASSIRAHGVGRSSAATM